MSAHPPTISVLDLLSSRKSWRKALPPHCPVPEMGPGQVGWPYDRSEIIVDAAVHVVGLLLGVFAAVALVVVVVRTRVIDIAPAAIYVAGLLTMLVLSAAYNLWPVSRTKWLLRRFDHSAIYLLIAATYTPFLALLKNGLVFVALSVTVWSTALLGVLLKLALPGRFDRLSIALYLILGWSGLVAYDHVISDIPSSSLWLLLIGGILFSFGVLFHLWERLRFQNAIWHAFVLLALGCHYSAVVACAAANS
jgi:hemolysin III